MSSSGSYGGKVFAGQIEEFQVGTVSHILAGRLFIVRSDEGVLALWHRCTHLGCSVPWAQDENQFHCPCHGSLFNQVGEVTGGPAPRPLDMFPITITDDEIWVDTGKPIQRTNFEPSQITRI
jgi:cytochrome b6-f complex iron-sulfur subunit